MPLAKKYLGWVGSLVVVVFLWALALILGRSMIEQSGAGEVARRFAFSTGALADRCGELRKVNLSMFHGGHFRQSGNHGTASLVLLVEGTRSRGRLDLDLEMQRDVWKVTHAVLKVKGETIVLDPHVESQGKIGSPMKRDDQRNSGRKSDKWFLFLLLSSVLTWGMGGCLLVQAIRNRKADVRAVLFLNPFSLAVCNRDLFTPRGLRYRQWFFVTIGCFAVTIVPFAAKETW